MCADRSGTADAGVGACLGPDRDPGPGGPGRDRAGAGGDAGQGTAGALVFMAAVLLLKKGFAGKRLVGVLTAGIVVTAAIVMASTPVVERIMTLTQSDGNLQIPANALLFTSLSALTLRN